MFKKLIIILAAMTFLALIAINGIGEAADFYFGKPVQDLSLSEAAAIAGLIKAPDTYSPYTDKRACHKGKNLILAAMVKKGWITEQEYQTEKEVALEPVGFTA